MSHVVTARACSSTGGGASTRLAHATAVLAILLSIPALLHAQAPPPSAFPGEAPAGPAAVVLTFTAEDAALDPGESTVLRWEVINAFVLSIQPDVGIVGTRGSETLAPDRTTTYTLEATGSGGTVTDTVTITVAGTEPRVSGSSAALADKPVPRLEDGRPDLSGLYIGGRDVRVVGDIELTAAGEALRSARETSDLGQGADCLPPGVPGATTMPFPLQIVARPDVVVIMYEAYHLFRIIPVGRPHADYLAPAWMGHSVARWEGETLVVDVAGFNDRTQVAGHPHTQALDVEERYTRVAYDRIEYEAIVRDPDVFAEPVRYAGDLTLRPEWEIGEYICTENNQDYEALLEGQ